jgi:hypothetical protein
MMTVNDSQHLAFKGLSPDMPGEDSISSFLKCSIVVKVRATKGKGLEEHGGRG